MTYNLVNDFKGRGKEWCPGADSNHRHADFQYAFDQFSPVLGT